jgi:hypothetical protein
MKYTTKLDVIIQCELGREPGGQTSLPDNNLVLVSVNDINSFMTILIIIIFSFESNQTNLDLWIHLFDEGYIYRLICISCIVIPCNILIYARCYFTRYSKWTYMYEVGQIYVWVNIILTRNVIRIHKVSFLCAKYSNKNRKTLNRDVY